MDESISRSRCLENIGETGLVGASLNLRYSLRYYKVGQRGHLKSSGSRDASSFKMFPVVVSPTKISFSLELTKLNCDLTPALPFCGSSCS